MKTELIGSPFCSEGFFPWYSNSLLFLKTKPWFDFIWCYLNRRLSRVRRGLVLGSAKLKACMKFSVHLNVIGLNKCPPSYNLTVCNYSLYSDRWINQSQIKQPFNWSTMFKDRASYKSFSNSLVLHEEKTKEITTMEEVWICGHNYSNIWWIFALNFSGIINALRNYVKHSKECFIW